MAEFLKAIPPVGPLPTFTRNVNFDDEKQKMLEMWSNQARSNNSHNEMETNTANIGEHNSKIKKGK